ncbi:uncharacterized protein K452DRAFT_338756 [Aplosporella prunicola CBS 121167]|uniref:Transmembrane protein n=1 Tax=Aplosporella prunicola CBS 121167 TaxID=1176127 RepID=A0A6A6B469_9PEZI|nr:uncharacterized protein K452DRAFT_338756 [Aplosporella prunicola CBS 121167]KAF2138626.1 hypothetical protein K452DRAFT_338756 [Aplosporella prunicola CBS 121167]
MSQPTGHICRKRKDPSRPLLLTRAWWYIPLHFICSTALSVTVILLNGEVFPVDRTSTYRISQSDITTLIAAGLRLTSLLGSTWHGILAWRCTFIAIELSGLSFSEIAKQISWRSGPLIPRKSLLFWISTALFLPWPALMAGPVLTGSVSWVPNNKVKVEKGNIVTISQVTEAMPPRWASVVAGPLGAQDHVLIAAGASYFNFNKWYNNGKESVRNPRRVIPQLNGIPVNSSLSDVVMPHFKITRFEWVQTLDLIPKEVQKQVQNRTTDWFTLGNTGRPITNSLLSTAGTALLVRNKKDHPLNGTSFPKPSTVAEETFGAIYLRYHDDAGNGTMASEGCSNTDTPVKEYLWISFDNVIYCIAMAKLKWKAGVISCKDPILVADTLLECREQNMDHIDADPLVEFTLQIIPETVRNVMWMSTVNLDIEKNTDAYFQNILTLTYHGAWSANVEDLKGPRGQRTLVKEPVQANEARIEFWRVYTWLALNVLVAFSGIIVCILQKKCSRQVVREPVLAALMLDPTPIFENEQSGLCDTDNLDKSNDSKGRVRLHTSTSSGSLWSHDKLWLEDPEKDAESHQLLIRNEFRGQDDE